MIRILVTGSRDWSDRDVVLFALLRETPYGPATLVHGACPTGADAIADQLGRVAGYTVETHPADWEKYGNSAGQRRNTEMVNLGATVCVAFIGRCSSRKCKITESHPSHGASRTAKLAEAAGIPTRRYYA